MTLDPSSKRLGGADNKNNLQSREPLPNSGFNSIEELNQEADQNYESAAILNGSGPVHTPHAM